MLYLLINKNRTRRSLRNEALFTAETFLPHDGYLCCCVHNLQLNGSLLIYIRSCIVFISTRFLLVSSDSGSTQNCKSRVSAINNLAVDATSNNDNNNDNNGNSNSNSEVHKIYRQRFNQIEDRSFFLIRYFKVWETDMLNIPWKKIVYIYF